MNAHHPGLYDSFALYGSGVTLLTVGDGDHDRFVIAASVLTASVEPFTLAVSVRHDRDVVPAMLGGAPWAVAVLTAAHLPLVHQLTGSTTSGQRVRSLRAAGVERSAEGPLWLPDALVTLWCTVHSSVPVHDQLLVTGEVIRGSLRRDAAPLLRWNRGFRTVTEFATPEGTAA